MVSVTYKKINYKSNVKHFNFIMAKVRVWINLHQQLSEPKGHMEAIKPQEMYICKRGNINHINLSVNSNGVRIGRKLI